MRRPCSCFLRNRNASLHPLEMRSPSRLPKIPLPTLISKGGAAQDDEAQPQPEISSKKKESKCLTSTILAISLSLGGGLRTWMFRTSDAEGGKLRSNDK